MEIGQKLKDLRLQKKFSLGQLAGKVGLTRSFLSQVEKDKTSPSIPSLIKILSALDTSIGEFFQTVEEKPSVFIKKKERRFFQDSESPTRMASLSTGFKNPRMEPFYVEFEGGRSSELISSQGEAFVFVFEGALELAVADESYILETGDSLYFDASIPHRITPDKDMKTSALFVTEKSIIRIH